jgi:uncharacterized integral membrane protein
VESLVTEGRQPVVVLGRLTAMTIEPSGDPEPGRSVRLRLISGGILAVLVLVFLFENTQSVAIRFVGPKVHAPLIVALLVAAIFGALGTLLFQQVRSRR